MRLDMRSVIVGVLGGLAFSLAVAAVISGGGRAAGDVVEIGPRAKALVSKGPYQLVAIDIPSRYGASLKRYVIDQGTANVWELEGKDEAVKWKLVIPGPPKESD